MPQELNISIVNHQPSPIPPQHRVVSSPIDHRPSTINHPPVAVIGAGPAGCAAAVQLARRGVGVLLLDGSGRAGGLIANARSVENHPGHEPPLTGREWVARLQGWLGRFGVAVATARIGSVAVQGTGGFELVGEGFGGAFAAVVLATGTEPLPAAIPGEAELVGRGLWYEVAPALAQRPHRALVVGGGEAGYDYALSLADSGATVTVCQRSSRSRAGRRLCELVLAHPAIELRSRRSVSRLVAGEGGIVAEVGDDGPLEVDAVVVAVGRRPLLPSLTDGGGRSVELRNDSVLTSIPGLFIAGDARLGGLGQLAIALGDGLECAARAADHLAKLESSR